MSRRSQIIGQVFIYAMGLIIIALVVVFGYGAIKDLVSRSEELSYIDFKTKLTTAVEEMSSEYGSVKHREFMLPKGYLKICFVELDEPNPEVQNICNEVHEDYEPIVCNHWKDKSGENVFLIGKKFQAFFIGDEDKAYFKVAGNYLCPDVVNSRVALKIEGKGKYAEIS